MAAGQHLTWTLMLLDRDSLKSSLRFRCVDSPRGLHYCTSQYSFFLPAFSPSLLNPFSFCSLYVYSPPFLFSSPFSSLRSLLPPIVLRLSLCSPNQLNLLPAVFLTTNHQPTNQPSVAVYPLPLSSSLQALRFFNRSPLFILTRSSRKSMNRADLRRSRILQRSP